MLYAYFLYIDHIKGTSYNSQTSVGAVEKHSRQYVRIQKLPIKHLSMAMIINSATPNKW